MQLLHRLRCLCPPEIILKPRRLLSLMTVALRHQAELAFFSNVQESEHSLLRAMSTNFEDKNYKDIDRKLHSGLLYIPDRVSRLYTYHTDEVWSVNFSHSGLKLASASKDGTTRINNITSRPESSLILEAHSSGVTSAIFSFDDKYLLTTGVNDNLIKLWSVIDGKLIKSFDFHNDEVSSVFWLHNCHYFASGGIDKVTA